jgi:hypothetical protein
LDEVTYIEVLGRHGEVAARHAARALPMRIGRAYDNDLILEDPYVAPHHVVVERSPSGDLEIVDAGSRNGLFRAGSRHCLIRERVDPAARYRAGKTQFRVRSSTDPVAEELVDRGAGGLRELVVALMAVLAVAAVVLLHAWSSTNERTELAKLAQAPVLIVLALFIWSGAWGLAGRLLLDECRFAAHLTAAALTLIGISIADQSDYMAFALSAPGSNYLATFAVGAFLAWGLWRHLSLVIRNPGWGVALAAGAVAAVCGGSFALYSHVDRSDDLVHMAYLKAIKAPAVRLVKGSQTGQFFRDARKLKAELEALKRK